VNLFSCHQRTGGWYHTGLDLWAARKRRGCRTLRASRRVRWSEATEPHPEVRYRLAHPPRSCSG